MIYFIQAGQMGLIKIGYSKQPEQRVKKLQTGNPIPLKILATIEGDIDLEKSLHRQFDNYRAEGEWFYPVKPVLEVMKLGNKNGNGRKPKGKIVPLDKTMIAQPALFELSLPQLLDSPPSINNPTIVSVMLDYSEKMMSIYEAEYNEGELSWGLNFIRRSHPIVQEVQKEAIVISSSYGKWMSRLRKRAKEHPKELIQVAVDIGIPATVFNQDLIGNEAYKERLSALGSVFIA